MANTAVYARRRQETDWRRFRRIMRRRTAKFMQRNLLKILVICPFIIGMLFGIFVGAKTMAYAQSIKINDYGRKMVYSTYMVRQGDTIWGIAEDLSALNPEFNDIRQYVAAIQKANHIYSGDDIKSGDIILIPYYISQDGTVAHDELYSRYGIGKK